MKATAQYLKNLLEQKKRLNLADAQTERQIQNFDFENYMHEPPEMPDWAKAIRGHNNNLRTIHLP